MSVPRLCNCVLMYKMFIVSYLLTYLGDIEINVIQVHDLAPQEPDRVGGDVPWPGRLHAFPLCQRYDGHVEPGRLAGGDDALSWL